MEIGVIDSHKEIEIIQDDNHVFDKIETLRLAINRGWKKCMYGLGHLAIACGETMLSYLGVQADWYCDKNEKVLDC